MHQAPTTREDADEAMRGLLIGTALDHTGDPAQAAAFLLGASGQILATMFGNERAAAIMAGAANDAAALCAPPCSA